MSLNLTKLTADVNAHQNLSDQPALSAAELKQAWDQPASDIKTYLNNTLTTEIQSQVATDIAACLSSAKDYTDDEISGISQTATDISYDNTQSGISSNNVQGAISELKTTANTIASTANSKIKYTDFAVTSHSSGSLDNGHGGYATKSISISKSGYYPIGIVGFSSASVNHYNETNMGACLMEIRLSSASSGSGTIYGSTYVADNRDWTYGSSFTAYVLWVKVS